MLESFKDNPTRGKIFYSCAPLNPEMDRDKESTLQSRISAGLCLVRNKGMGRMGRNSGNYSGVWELGIGPLRNMGIT